MPGLPDISDFSLTLVIPGIMATGAFFLAIQAVMSMLTAAQTERIVNRRLQFNGALFYVDYEDFQSQTFDGSSIRVINAGNMESYGAEMELLFIPLPDTTLGSAIGYNKAEYGSFDNGQCTVEQAFEQYYIVDGAQGGAPGLTMRIRAAPVSTPCLSCPLAVRQ